MKYFLFNPLANNSQGEQVAKKWANTHNVEGDFISVIGLNYKDFFEDKKDDDEVYLCGGDGTLSIFANDTYGMDFACPIYLVKSGTGNDFFRDIEEKYAKDDKVELRPFLKNLPIIHVNGITRRFINGIGYGIDGDTCLVGDELKEKNPGVDVNYSKIAISLLLGKFNTKNATVIADGKEYHYKNAWLSSAMYGRFYGGGMNAAPSQDRLNNNKTCTVTTLSSYGRIVTLLRFPTFSAGKHDKKKYINHVVGKHIEVSFDSPCALQIDGDVVKDVTTYTVDFD